jgi:hypothetical protein
MQKKAIRHILISMDIYLVAYSQRWDQTISFSEEMYDNKIMVPVFRKFPG